MFGLPEEIKKQYRENTKNDKITRGELNSIVDGLETILEYYLSDKSPQTRHDMVTLVHSKRVAESYTEMSICSPIIKYSFELIDLDIAGYICGSLWHDIVEDTDEFDIKDLNSMKNMRSIIEALLYNIAEKSNKTYPGLSFSYLTPYFLATNFEEKSKVILDTMIKTIDILTRRDKETYNEYINRIIQSKDKEIVRIKICDIMDHLVNFETLKPSLKKRYIKALETLLEFEVINNEENNS